MDLSISYVAFAGRPPQVLGVHTATISAVMGNLAGPRGLRPMSDCADMYVNELALSAQSCSAVTPCIISERPLKTARAVLAGDSISDECQDRLSVRSVPRPTPFIRARPDALQRIAMATVPLNVHAAPADDEVFDWPVAAGD